jgi:flagellar basal body-associated protein FliL
MAEQQAQEQASPPQVQGKKKGGLIKIIIIGVAALGLAGGAGYYFLGRKAATPAHKEERAESREKKEAKARKSESKEKGEVGAVLALDPFIINVSGNASRFAKISLALEVKDEKALEHTKKMVPVIRDSMLSVLGAKAPEVFMDVKGRAEIKKEIFESIDPLFKEDILKGVYITDIIMQ